LDLRRFIPTKRVEERERAPQRGRCWALIQPGRELRLSTRSKHLMVYVYTLYSIEEAARTNRRRRETIRRYCKPFSTAAAAAAAILSGNP
jgi:hypothetical protein